MLRVETETGWWLITHPDQARLAENLAAVWGNDKFREPEPRDRVLRAIAHHHDGWAARDAQPAITSKGEPAALTAELIGKPFAFEEIDLDDYFTVRERSVRMMAEEDPYAALLISMHAHNLLTERVDRSTIAAANLPLLDGFLEKQRAVQASLLSAIAADGTLSAEQKSEQVLLENVHLLQACDHLSLLGCLAYSQPANLLHALPLNDGTTCPVEVTPLAPRYFRLTPWPFPRSEMIFRFPARHAQGKAFASSAELAAAFTTAQPTLIAVTLAEE